MTDVTRIRYTKDDGEMSERRVIVLARPRKNFLMYDVSKLSEEAIDVLLTALNKAEDYKANAMADFELLTEEKQSSLWRSFKADGLEWIDEDENS